MVSAVDGGPSYISSHSADVILSDIRPIKLKPEALRAINVLLDEFLSKILSTSCSLVPDKLRASLLSLLPTSLGKEALLEAEVELRAYWERTDSTDEVEDDAGTFHLQWAFSLLRLKCEAYSTLNEQDEDPNSENRVNEMFEKVYSHPPKSILLDPAALYLTAILESMCEHVLSNVGRVAARDSSRTSATVNDLFVALCEDDSIYGLFRTMKVYEQIEMMSKAPKSRRSRSFSRNDRHSISRTSTPQQEQIAFHSPSGSRSRQSSEGQLAPMTASNSGSRASFEKARAIRMFANNKGAPDPDIQSSHNRSESLRSDNSRAVPDDDLFNPAEDAEMLREFDDLMRTTSTMKVSLTPDRLKTMEVYKQEKDQRGQARRSGTQLSSKPEPDVFSSSRTNPLPRHVDAIVEDDEDAHSPKVRTRQGSVATPPTTSFIPPVPTRSRSVSTSSGIPSHSSRKPSRNASITAAPSAFPRNNNTPDMMVQSRDLRAPRAPDNSGFGGNGGFPARTRVRQRNRDSLDLDDVMNGSDGEEEQEPPQPVRQPPRSPSTPKRANGTAAVSAKTRELMDFLAEGPPEPPVSNHGRDLMNFLAEGPQDFSSSANDSAKPKSAGRLQRMISKLNLGNGEKAKSPVEPVRVVQPIIQPIPPRPPIINPQQSYGSLSSLANRPIPPRPAPPLSPPSSPSQSHDSSDENRPLRNPTPRKSFQNTTTITRSSPVVEKVPSLPPSPVPAPVAASPDFSEKSSHRRPSPPQVTSNGNFRNDKPPPKEILTDAHPVVPIRTFSNPPTRKPVPSVIPASSPSISENDVRDMQRLLASATTADECRLIFDMFIARNGMSKVPKAQVVPYPSPTPSVVRHTARTGVDTVLESSLVELLLGGLASVDIGTAEQQPTPHSVDGLPQESGHGHTQNTTLPEMAASVPCPAAPVEV